MTARPKETILTTMAAFPVVWLLLLYLFILRARLHFGHWPSASDDLAGRHIDFPLLRELTLHTLFAAAWVALAVLVTAIIFRRRDPGFRVGLPMTVLGVSALLSAAAFVIDPGRFIFWFFD